MAAYRVRRTVFRLPASLCRIEWYGYCVLDEDAVPRRGEISLYPNGFRDTSAGPKRVPRSAPPSISGEQSPSVRHFEQ